MSSTTIFGPDCIYKQIIVRFVGPPITYLQEREVIHRQ